ncbi:vacuolar protein sorting/targeting protein PEP1 [Coemansia sp. Benny D115]|nr:vacuolar protein sorting/targeting protein PEP1 [Coemansia sp. Benny D115]
MRLLSRLPHAAATAAWVCLLLLALSPPTGVVRAAKPDMPTVRYTYFKESLSKLVYFKSPATMLGIDKARGKIYRSADNGESWHPVSGVPEGKPANIYAHPHEPLVAYALSADTEHWVTRDEGKTWTPFSTPLAPTTSGERPLSFHAERSGWILFIAERCKQETGGWWPFPRLMCHDEVFYVKDGFVQAAKDYKSGDRSGSAVMPLIGQKVAVSRCTWARHNKEFMAMAEEAIFCIEIASQTFSSDDDNASRRSNAKRSMQSDRQHLVAAPLTTASLEQLPKVHRRSLLHPSAATLDLESEYAPIERAISLESAEGKEIRRTEHPQKRSLAKSMSDALGSQATGNAFQLVVSEDFFATKRIVHFGSGNDGTGGDRAGGGVVAISIVKGYILAAISHANSEEMDLFVSMDGHVWAESHLPLPPGSKEDAYTVLESTVHSVFVDVLTSSSGAVGTLFRSNSNGTYYTQSLEHTHRTTGGLVDVERVHGVEGVVIANQVANWEKVGKGSILHREKLELRSRISFNDGARWRFLRPPERDLDGKRYGCSKDAWQTGDCALHLHSVTSTRSVGHVFGSPSAPGVILAVGNVGSKLLPWRECDTFLSRDGGLTWQMIHKDAHHVQLIDSGAVMVLVNDEVPTDVISFSADGGSTWQHASLDHKVRISSLFIDDSGLSAVTLAVGTVREGSHNHEQVIVAADFSKIWSRQCAVDPKDPKAGTDMEEFVLIANEDNDCVMGHRAEHIRRKADAQCFMRLDQLLVPRQTDCACTSHDFECDYNYALDAKGSCTLVGEEVIPRGQCLRKGDRFMASSGYRAIPGNTCLRDRGKVLDAPVEKPCPRVQSPGDGGNGNGNDNGNDNGSGSGKKLGPISHHTLVVHGDPHIMSFPNSTSFLLMTSAQELYRTDNEGYQWAKIDLARATGNSKIGKPVYLAAHLYANTRAFIYTDNDLLVYTQDRGKSWQVIKNLPAIANSLHIRPLIDYNPHNPDWLMFMGGTTCPGCHTEIWVSPDNGKKWSRITTHATKCRFAHSKEFAALPDESIVCTNYRLTSGKDNEQDKQPNKKTPENYVEVRVFTKPFVDSSFHTIALPSPENSEIVGMHIYSRFIVLAVIETLPDDTGRPEALLKMYVSEDGRSVHEARFPPGINIKPEGFTLLRGHAGTILVDVEGAPNTGDPDWGTGWGTLFASNRNGTHFHMVLQNTNRNHMGLVDIERVKGLDGMLIANRVVNAQALGKPGVHKQLRTMATWDDGRSWHPLTPPEKDSNGRAIDCIDCSLHLYSRSSMVGASTLYGVSTAPGYLMGVGTVGTHLGRVRTAATYLSRDGGMSWSEVRSSEAQYEFGDHGSILVLIDDSGPTDSLQYSVDGGSLWNTYRFTSAGQRVIVDRITNGVDSGGEGFLILAREVSAVGGVNSDDAMVIFVDFSGIYKRKCSLDTRDHGKSDFELWTPHSGMDSHGHDSAICVLGSETSYWRRKSSAECFVGDEFAPPMTSGRSCECTIQDYECEEGFWLNDYGECTLDGPDPYQPADCREGTTYKGRSGYLKIAQSQCTGGKDLTQPVDRICGRSGGLHAKAQVFDSPIVDLQYFKNSHHIVARTRNKRVWVSLDEGGRWIELPLPDSSSATIDSAIHAIISQPYFEDYAYFLPEKGTVAMYTDDEARTTRVLHLPAAPAHVFHPALRFHPDYPDWLIFLGQPNENCRSVDASNCQVEAFVSRDHGAHWDALVAPLGTGGCSFVKTDRLTKAHRNSIVCMRHPDAHDNGGSIVVSDNWFTKSEHELLKGALDFDIVGEFLLMANGGGDAQQLQMHISLDGTKQAAATFPGNKQTMNSGYTVLEPPEGFEYRDERGHNQKMPGAGLMMHVTTSDHVGAEWGTLYVSNSNGTYYRQTLELVNRDENGLVDFERIQALEGVSIANTVSNSEEVLKKNKSKRLQTRITVDGGSRWHYLRVDGTTPCRMTAPSSGSCALHLFGYTEMSDPVNIYSAEGAVGMIMGVGNVGSSLGHIGEANTYLSTDGGASWKQVRKGPMWHEFGDHGGIIVVADRLHPISEIEYSLDRGASWLKLQLPDEAQAMRVEILTTTPDSTSRRFVLYGKKDNSDRGIIVGLDFVGAQPRICKFDPLDERSHKNQDDFELFSPKPVDLRDESNGCLLGRKVQYYRRIADRQCYVGEEFQPARYISETCECTIEDYECNHNFVREFSPDDPSALGKCVLVKGMQAPRTNCTAGQKDYFTIEAAYRKIPQSICVNGLVLDRPKEVWCPGKARMVAIFWALFLPVFFLSLAYVAYHTWRNQYPYLRLEDIGSAVVRPALRHLGPPAANAGALQQLQPIFHGAASTVKAIGNAAKEGFLWTLDRAAPYLPHSVQRWSYEHPPRWGAQLSMDGRSRRAIRHGEGGSRFAYHPLSSDDAAAAHIFGTYDESHGVDIASGRGVDEFDEFEAGFNHFLEEENFDDGIGLGEDDARPVDQQVLFANTELSGDENEDAAALSATNINIRSSNASSSSLSDALGIDEPEASR